MVLIPVGSQEQHDPYLCMACDIARSLEFARRLAAHVYPLALVAPAVPLGVSPHHLPFPGTISLRPETLAAVLLDVVDSMRRHGIRKFLAINGHGGNEATLGVVAHTLLRQGEVGFAYVNFKAFGSRALDDRIAETSIQHAGPWEVSMAMELAPALVRREALVAGDFGGYPYRHTAYESPRRVQIAYTWDMVTSNGVIGDPRAADALLGRQMVEEALVDLADFVRDFAKDPPPSRLATTREAR
jgi:creatinine amidohydrolase